MRKALLVILLLGMALGSCKFNPDVQDTGSAFIQGEWEEIPVSYQDELLQYTRHQFRFTCDSFYLTLQTKAKTNIYPDSCFKGGEWTEYAKGTYRQSSDTIYLTGTFTKANWKQKISGCYRIGQYLDALVVEKVQNNTLSLKSLSRHLPVQLRQTNSGKCDPKDLN
jgi:hypothetical protein